MSRSRWARSPRRRAAATTDPLAYKDAIFISPHKFIGGPGTPGRPRRPPGAVPEPRPVVPGGGTVAYVNPTEHVYLDRHRASRGGRHAGDRRVDPGRPRVRAQGGGRRRGDPRARGVVHPTGDRALGSAPAIEILGNPALDRLSIVSFVGAGRGARRGPPLSPPQLRRRAAQRPVRDPVARRLLVRRAVRPPPARHRPRDARTSSSARSAAAARASSPAGSGSTSTTSSARPVFEFILDGGRARRDATAGGCCRTTGSSRRPGCGSTPAARPIRR